MRREVRPFHVRVTTACAAQSSPAAVAERGYAVSRSSRESGVMSMWTRGRDPREPGQGGRRWLVVAGFQPRDRGLVHAESRASPLCDSPWSIRSRWAAWRPHAPARSARARADLRIGQSLAAIWLAVFSCDTLGMSLSPPSPAFRLPGAPPHRTPRFRLGFRPDRRYDEYLPDLPVQRRRRDAIRRYLRRSGPCDCTRRTGSETVGSAYVGSNPTPATPWKNGPLARKRGRAGRFSLVTACIWVCTVGRCMAGLTRVRIALGTGPPLWGGWGGRLFAMGRLRSAALPRWW